MNDAAPSGIEASGAAPPFPRPRSRRRVLVTGGRGMLARDLAPAFGAAGYEAIFPSKAQLDIGNRGHVDAVLATFRPEILVNCAAFTKVDQCETSPLAEALNDRAVGELAAACTDRGVKLVHLSTDFVFDGEKREPYEEDDPPNPISAYGRTKRAGEIKALAAPGALLVRASWLFGNHGPNFIEAMLAQAESGARSVRVVTDQVGRPTATTDLAEAIVALLDRDIRGIVHFANAGEVSWNAFAREIYRLAGYGAVEVAPIRSVELGRPARRPAYSVLSTRRYETLTGRTPRDFREPLAEYLERRSSSQRQN